jgi:AraC-like DNA-binding protein
MQRTRTMPSPRTGARGAARQGERLMWLTPHRVFYAGLLGAAAARTMGGHGVCVSPAGAPPNRIRIGGGAWQTGELIVVPPHVPHQVESAHPLIFSLLIESESVDPARMPAFLQHCGPVEAPAFVQRVRDAHAHLLAASGRGTDFEGFDFDTLFFGESLAPRTLDARIRKVADAINADPAAPMSAEDCAASVHLSFSRFLHLFKQETGMAFRAFRAWKRARSLLRYVRQDSTLTDIALDTGYPRLHPLQPFDPPGVRPETQRHPGRLAAPRAARRGRRPAALSAARRTPCRSFNSCSRALRKVASTG